MYFPDRFYKYLTDNSIVNNELKIFFSTISNNALKKFLFLVKSKKSNLQIKTR